MAHLYKKVKKGREYFYIRETQRVYGKPTTVNQVYLGTADKVQAVLQGDQQAGQGGFSPREFGSIFILNEIDRAVDLAGIVDEILPPKKRTKGPSLGDFFFYAALNRAIDPKSKRKLPSWYEATDIQRVRPVRLESLNSQNFWNHWDRIGETELEKIVTRFFARVHSLLPAGEEQLLLETTSYYSSPGYPNALDLMQGLDLQTGKLPPRKVGLALITERFSGVPVFFQNLPGDLQDLNFFQQALRELAGKVKGVGVKTKDLTILFGNGVESPEIIEWMDSQEGIHFIAAQPPEFAPELSQVPMTEFRPFPCKTNRKLIEDGAESDQILYYETQGIYWDRPRKVVVIYDPRAFQKRYQELREKIQKVRRELSSWQRKQQQTKGATVDLQGAQERLEQVCENLQLKPALFKLSLDESGGKATLTFQLVQQEVESLVRQFAKSFLITDLETWGTTEICQSFVDRCILEGATQDNRDPFHSTLTPQYHWTDSKIRIHIFVCFAALTYHALLCQRLNAAGLLITSKEAVEELRNLHTAIFWQPDKAKLKRTLAEPSDMQMAILRALGFEIQDGKLVSLQ